MFGFSKKSATKRICLEIEVELQRAMIGHLIARIMALEKEANIRAKPVPQIKPFIRSVT